MVGDSPSDGFDVGMNSFKVEDTRISRRYFAFEDEVGVDVKGSILVLLAGDTVVSDKVGVETSCPAIEELLWFKVKVGVREEDRLGVKTKVSGRCWIEDIVGKFHRAVIHDY